MPKTFSLVNFAITSRHGTILDLICLLTFWASGVQAENNQDLTGLWRGEIDRWHGDPNRSSLSGEITVDGSKSEWSVSIRDKTFPLQRNKNEISSAWFNDSGQFRAHIVDPKTLEAFWIQARDDINKNEYATPIELKPAGENLWRGSIQPLESRLSFWLSIQRGSDGSLNAVIRNPELNLFRREVYRVDQQGDKLTFVNTKDAKKALEARVRRITVPETTVLDLSLPPVSHSPIEFLSIKPEQAVGFAPRTNTRASFIYAKPQPEDDGWRTAELSGVGLKEKTIAELITKICHADPTDNSLNIHSLLIARHGKLVLEEYFYGFKGEPHTMRSASKTFAPMLIGIARDKGAKIDINTQVLSQFPEYKEFAQPDTRKEKITVGDLMTMTSGLACDDSEENSPGNEDVMQQQTAQPDWYKYTLDLPMARDPGGNQAVYCSAGINLLGGIVRNTTQTWLPEFFYDYVAKPLQIKTYHWNLLPNGDGYAGGGLYLRPRDQLKLGQLYLNGGVWNGRRVISKDWVEKSTLRQSTFGQTLGADHDYGYGWHLYHFEVGHRTYRAYAAGGNGGQIVMVIPDLDLVVGFTGGAYGEFAKWYKWQTELVPQFIIPAAVSTLKH